MFAIDSYALNNNGPHDPALKKITISDPGQKLVLQLDYSDGCKITQLKVKGKNVLSESGVILDSEPEEVLLPPVPGRMELRWKSPEVRYL